MIALLLFQDVIAIIVLVIMESVGAGDYSVRALLMPLVTLPILAFVSWLSVKSV
jgi:hypothetical protein